MPKPSTWILFALGCCCALWVVLASGQTPEPLGDDHRLNETTSFDFSPDIDMDARGNFVVVWAYGQFDYFNRKWDVWGRRFASNGQAKSDAFRINDDRAGQHGPAEVAMTPDGRFVVVWSVESDYLFPREIRGRRFDAGGHPLGGDFLIPSAGTGHKFYSVDVATNPQGDFVVVWKQEEDSGSETIQARRFSPEGVALDEEFLVDPYDTVQAYFPVVQWTPDGGFLVVWVTIEGGKGQRFSAEGVPVGLPFTVHDTYARGIISSLDVAPSGQFVVSWMEFESSAFDDTDIFARIFSPDGAPLSDRFQVNSVTSGIQEYAAVATERDGEFIVVWNSRTPVSNDDWGDSVQGQRFSSAGERVGAEFQVNTYTTYDQFEPTVAARSGRGFVVAWTSWEDFPYNAWIRGRRFRPSPPFCTATETTACLSKGRFRVEVEWRNPSGLAGPGRRVHFGSDDSALFWFFSPDNWEILVKVLDGCAINHHFWVFAASTTNLAYVLRVTDTETGEVREYENPPGKPADAVTDTSAFTTC